MDDAQPHRPTLLVIGGPTAVGKTDVGIELALRRNGEIISADSMQVYRRLLIGTARPTDEECRGVPYHGVALIEPHETFHLGAFIDLADRLIARIAARGRQPLVVGGTGLYIKGLLQGVFDSPEVDAALRDRLLGRAAAEGPARLHAELGAVDPEAARQISPNDPIRLTRALEVWQQTGRPISALWKESRALRARYPYYLFVLSAGREALHERIDRRIERMFLAGLPDEVRRLVDEGVAPECHAFKALGYRHVLAWLDGELSLREAMEILRTQTRQYAKRQLTWFRGMRGAIWIDVTGRRISDIADEIELHLATRPPATRTWHTPEAPEEER